ncbi:hypothetical protein, partial [Nocardia sp. NPDC019302]|uniref:hypothetical protein n=1 Tax=Nocardia sp. NPDC019302 TaxID=3154592 RepID=UPI0033CD864A
QAPPPDCRRCGTHLDTDSTIAPAYDTRRNHWLAMDFGSDQRHDRNPLACAWHSVYDPPGKAGRTLDVAIYPPVGKQLTAAQATQLAEKHLPYLAQPGAVVDYTIETRNGPGFAVFVGGCQPSWRDVSPESQPYARQYERCQAVSQ